MQGRLIPHKGRGIQFFPAGEWQEEFPIAKKIGFSSIEWLFDWVNFDENPILKESGIREIKEQVKKFGVKVNSICADYYMKYRLLGEEAKSSLDILNQLIDAASEITSERLILIPFLEANAIKSESEKKEIAGNIKKVIRNLKAKNVRIGFETEMPSEEILDFLKMFNSNLFGAYYDIGNCTSYGFDCKKDISILRNEIFGVHIKDRKVKSEKSMFLGSGDADFKSCFLALKEIGFNGNLIMQAFRGENYLDDAKKQFLFLKGILSKI